MHDDRLESVELELTGFRSHRDRHVVADDFVRDLIEDFGNDRIDLARHDRRTCLHRWKIDLVQSGSRARREQPEIVAHLGQLHSDPLEDAGEVDELAHVLGRFDKIRCQHQRQSGQCAQVGTGHLGVAGGCVEASADSSRTEVDLVNEKSGLSQTRPILLDHDRVGPELLTQGHRHGVLQLGASHLHCVGELKRFGRECVLECKKCIQQVIDREDRRDIHGRGVDVVGRLAQVHVFIGVKPFVVAALVAEDFQRAIGDDLVRIHVRRRAGATLDDVHHELFVPPPVHDLLACL